MDQVPLEKNVAAGLADNGADSLFIEADVSNSSDVWRMVKETIERYGRIDVLINPLVA